MLDDYNNIINMKTKLHQAKIKLENDIKSYIVCVRMH